MSAKMGSVLGLLLVMVLVSGCWNRLPVEKRGTVSILGIDAVASGYLVTAAVINPAGLEAPAPSGGGGGGGGGGQPMFLRQATAPTLAQAIHTLNASSFLLPDYTHLEDIVVSAAVARAGLASALEYPGRSPEFSHTAWLVVAQNGSAADLIRAVQKDLPRPNEVLSQTLDWARLHTPFTPERMMTAFKEMAMEGVSFSTVGVATGTAAQGSETVPLVVLSDALFRGDRLVGWVTGPAALGWAVAMGQVHYEVLPVPASQTVEAFDLELMGARRTVRVIPAGDAPPQVDLTFRVKAHLATGNAGSNPWQRPGALDVMQKAAATVLTSDVWDGLRTAQRDGSDSFGLGEFVRLADPAYWDLVRKNWAGGALGTLPLRVQVTVTIGSLGETFCTLLQFC